jgi:hypothetical protein
MKMENEIPTAMLAACGMNCKVCYVHLKKKKNCLGCRNQDQNKPEHCRQCKIKDCAARQGVDFCVNCPTFPCAILKRMDKSYQQRYQVSLIAQATRLQSIGMQPYLLEEKQRWTCPHCGGVLSLHDKTCSDCGKAMN